MFKGLFLAAPASREAGLMAKVSNETFEGTPSSREAGLMAKVSNETFDGIH